ncbi:hypothetical protein QQZ08_010074 [Neonectria magnoliae]|uniref:Vegetative incompatibility protein HET-E-1 n=1 Tax=Neonectria magnoliae TaxID=2732573 RepID=A0ABR1HK00_9HYPO
MDALGAAASIIAVVQISKQVVSLCTTYIEGVQDAPKDLRHILIEVSALSGLFETLKIVVGFDSQTAVLESQLSAPVEGCLKAILELNMLLATADVFHSASGRHDEDGIHGSKRGKRRKMTDLKIQMAWPLKRDHAKRLLELMSAYKSAGKTILASFLAENMANLAEKTSFEGEITLPKIAVYYYCHHARNHDEMGHFLAWLLSQLCRKAEDIPESICNLFKRDCRPHLNHLIDAIKLVATRFSSILISIDAVDESRRRETLAEFVKRLATDNEFGRFHVIVTSRKEADIQRH